MCFLELMHCSVVSSSIYSCVNNRFSRGRFGLNPVLLTLWLQGSFRSCRTWVCLCTAVLAAPSSPLSLLCYSTHSPSLLSPHLQGRSLSGACTVRLLSASPAHCSTTSPRSTSSSQRPPSPVSSVGNSSPPRPSLSVTWNLNTQR